MSCTIESSPEEWDRTFLDLSSKMAEPFCAAWHLLRYRLIAPLDPQKFENCTTTLKEIAVRAFIGLAAIFCSFLLYTFPLSIAYSVTALGTSRQVFRSIGFALQKRNYTHVRGIAPEKMLDPEDPQIQMMSWNICGVGGGMSLDHGGVISWRSRLDTIVETIKTEDPDVLILQEVYDTALAEALIEKLQSNYAHFFIHLGPNIWGSVGGCMVISRCVVHDFSHESFANNQWTLNRGFETLEIKATPQDSVPCVRIIGTHLIHGQTAEDQKKRMEQVAQMINHVAQQTLAIPTIVAGDLNIERDQAEGAFLNSHFDHAYQGSEPTCTNRLADQWSGTRSNTDGEMIDYISQVKNLPTTNEHMILADCHLVKAFDKNYDTKTARSDHHGLAARIIKRL